MVLYDWPNLEAPTLCRVFFKGTSWPGRRQARHWPLVQGSEVRATSRGWATPDKVGGVWRKVF